MTNQEDLQKELLEKVKPETKPSHLKKSKSASGLVPKAPPLPTSNLENQISVLELKLETQARERQSLLSDLQSKCDELQSKDDELTEKDVALTIYLEQLVVKQKKIEELKERLETNSDLAELDISLSARHRSLKDW